MAVVTREALVVTIEDAPVTGSSFGSICVGGVWKVIAEVKIAIGGVWKVVSEWKVAVGGAWKAPTA